MAAARTERPIESILPTVGSIASPPVVTESATIAGMQEIIDRQAAELARLRDPSAEQYERLKQAVFHSGVARQTLERWVRAGLVKHYRDAQGNL
jgi:hypothetical protein